MDPPSPQFLLSSCRRVRVWGLVDNLPGHMALAPASLLRMLPGPGGWTGVRMLWGAQGGRAQLRCFNWTVIPGWEPGRAGVPCSMLVGWL